MAMASLQAAVRMKEQVMDEFIKLLSRKRSINKELEKLAHDRDDNKIMLATAYTEEMKKVKREISACQKNYELQEIAEVAAQNIIREIPEHIIIEHEICTLITEN